MSRFVATAVIAFLLAACGRTKAGIDVEFAITQLNDKSDQVRADAARRLGESADPRAVEPLLAALNDRYSNVQDAASDSLGKLKGERTVDLTIAFMQKNHGNSAAIAAARALGKLGDRRAVESLFNAAHVNPIFSIARPAAAALGQLGDRSVVERVMPELEHQDPVVRSSAVMMLGWMKDPRAYEPLAATLLNDSDEKVREEAAIALGNLGHGQPIGPSFNTT